MGYDRQTCTGVVGRACGGMLGVHGVKQVFGGTLPAAIFARTFEILREIKAAEQAAQAGRAPPPSVEPVPPPAPAPGSLPPAPPGPGPSPTG